jgi:hypothetical protein
LGLEFVVVSLWGALSDERPGLSFVIHSLITNLVNVYIQIANKMGFQRKTLTTSQETIVGIFRETTILLVLLKLLFTFGYGTSLYM